MREITEIKQVFTFSELSPEAKEVVKQRYLDGQESSILTDMMQDDLYNLGFKDSKLKIQYSLNYCQGDGLNIYGDLNFYDCLEVDSIKEKFTNKEIETLKSYFDNTGCYEYELLSNNHYSYCIAKNQFIIDGLLDELEVNDIKYDVSLLKKFDLVVADFLYTLCKSYEEWGYNYFYEISETDLEEYCNDNDYEFFENGKLYF